MLSSIDRNDSSTSSEVVPTALDNFRCCRISNDANRHNNEPSSMFRLHSLTNTHTHTQVIQEEKEEVSVTIYVVLKGRQITQSPYPFIELFM